MGSELDLLRMEYANPWGLQMRNETAIGVANPDLYAHKRIICIRQPLPESIYLTTLTLD